MGRLTGKQHSLGWNFKEGPQEGKTGTGCSASRGGQSKLQGGALVQAGVKPFLTPVETPVLVWNLEKSSLPSACGVGAHLADVLGSVKMSL